MLGTRLGSGPRYELFAFVDAAFNRAGAAGVEVRHEPETMPWGNASRTLPMLRVTRRVCRPQRDTGIGLDAACASAFRFELGKRPPPIAPPTAAARNSCQSQSKRRLTAGSVGMFDAVPAPSNSRRDRRSVGPVPRCGQRTVTRHSVGICWNQAHAAVGRAEAMRYSLIRRRSAGRQSGTDNSEASRKGVQYRRNNLPVCGPGTVRVSSSFSSRVSMPPNLLARSLAPCAARPTGARLRTSAQRTRRWCA